MRKRNLVCKQALIFFGLTLISYLTTLMLALFLKPAPLANILGFLALVTYLATLLPSIVKTVFPTTKGSKFIACLLRHRRYIGITAFAFGLDHGFILIIQKDINLLDLHTYVEYFQGISILTIFTFLAITSNNWSVKKLKANWKKLHQLTYLVIFLMPWHILDKMSGHWSYLTPLGVLFSITTVVLFLRRRCIEVVESKRKQETKKNSKALEEV